MVKITAGKQHVHEAEPKKPSRADRKPRPGADGQPILLRLQPDLLKIVDACAKKLACSRPEAIRRMILAAQIAMTATPTKRRNVAEDAERAGW